MRRRILTLSALALAGCTITTAPIEVKLDDLQDPPPNQAGVAVTEEIENATGEVALATEIEYYFTLLLPATAPQLTYIQGESAATLRIGLPDTEATGVFTTADDSVDFSFTAPDGSTYRPLTSCRITVTSALDLYGAGRLRGKTDCPATNGVQEFRILAKFDYSPG